jgi:hypothetical protein
MRFTGSRIRRNLSFLAMLLAITGMAGCGSGGKYRVRGQLQYEDGSPLSDLAGFEVTFTSEKLGRSSRGEIQGDGTFELSTSRANDGVLPGDYKVTVSQPHVEPGRPEKRNPFVELMYEDPTLTPIGATVQANDDNNFTFKLTRIKKPAR